MKMPGRSTCAESSVDCGSATLMPARRTSSERRRYRSKKTRSPPMPRSTRRPATVSAPTAVSRPTCSRCSRCRSWSGRITSERLPTSTGTPSSTTSPSRVDVDSSTAATTRYDDDRARKPRGDVERATRPERVVRDGGDDLAGGQARSDRRAGQRRVVRDDLDHPESRLQPVADRDAVPERAGDRLDDAEPEEGGRPGEQRLGVAGRDPLVDRAPEHPRQQRLREHPDDPEGHAQQERAELLTPDPEQEAGRRARVRRAWVGEGKLLHRRASLCREPGKSAMMKPWPSETPSR